MNTQQARAALAAANLVLTLAVVGLGYWTFVAHHTPPADSSVPVLHPAELALPATTRAQDPFAEYSVIWGSIDKPPPPPPPPAPVGPPQPTVEDLSNRFKVTLVAIATEGAHYAILEPKTGGESVVITEKEQLPVPYQAYKCTRIEEQPGKCVVTLEDSNHHPSRIELKNEDPR